MRIKLFTIPIADSDKGERELNEFCSSHTIAAMEKHFVADGHNSFWAFCFFKGRQNNYRTVERRQ